MRTLVTLAALLAWMPVAHAAVESKTDIKIEGEYRVRTQWDQAWKTASDSNDTNRHSAKNRFKLGLNAKLSEKLSVHMVALSAFDFGDGLANNSTTSQKDGIGNSSNAILMNQAYAVWMLSDEFFLKFGRGNAQVGDGTSISINEWQQIPYSFDGVMFNWEKESFRLNGFSVKISDNLSISGGGDDPETRFNGLAYTQKALPDFLKAVGVAWSKTDVDEYTTPGPAIYRRNDMRYSAYLNGDVAGIDYRASYVMHDGDEKPVLGTAKRDKKGDMWQAELGYSLPELMKSRIYAKYHVDSGGSSTTSNDKFDGQYYEKHATSGYMDIIGWGNLTFINAGFTMSPMDQLEIGLHYWKFERTETGAGAYAGCNINSYAGMCTAVGTGWDNAGSDSSDIGQEIDLVATKKYDGGFAISSWVGAFMPGKWVKDNTVGNNDDMTLQVFLEGKMTF